MTAVRTFAFADLDAGVWGAAWSPASDEPVLLALGAGADAAVLPGSLEGDGEDGDWRLRADGAELVLSPAGDAVATGSTEEQSDGFDQLCRVSGQFTLDGDTQEVRCLGWRAAREASSERERPASFRQVAGWFEPGDGLAVLALRPRKSRGHDRDLLTAALLEPEPAGPVSDPRLSTTYSEAGLPIRAGVELWVGEEEAERYPRRAAGEALGAAAGWTVGDLELRARPFRWHSRGREGAGVYLLGERAG